MPINTCFIHLSCGRGPDSGAAQEEVAELRKAEKQRIERAARKGVQQIWLAA